MAFLVGRRAGKALGLKFTEPHPVIKYIYIYHTTMNTTDHQNNRIVEETFVISDNGFDAFKLHG